MFEVQPRYQGELAVDYALRVLHHNIMTLHLEPGQIIRENELTERLGISRTPLREALIRLASMYLIDIVPQSSTRVSLIDSDLIKEGIFLRLQVEPAIAERVCAEIGENDIMRLEDMLAMQKRLLESGRFEELLVQDNAFHEKLYQICGAEKTFRAVSAICGQYNIMRTLSLYHYTTKIAVREHGGILKAIKERDAAAARKIMIEHINRHSKEYKTIEKNFPRYFLRVEGV
ncbi:MAG: GntR family transcriptional regulator [Treponema sp.]|nr:GntR family transcriptional regulator [Treponema sp.]